MSALNFTSDSSANELSTIDPSESQSLLPSSSSPPPPPEPKRRGRSTRKSPSTPKKPVVPPLKVSAPKRSASSSSRDSQPPNKRSFSPATPPPTPPTSPTTSSQATTSEMHAHRQQLDDAINAAMASQRPFSNPPPNVSLAPAPQNQMPIGAPVMVGGGVMMTANATPQLIQPAKLAPMQQQQQQPQVVQPQLSAPQQQLQQPATTTSTNDQALFTELSNAVQSIIIQPGATAAPQTSQQSTTSMTAAGGPPQPGSAQAGAASQLPPGLFGMPTQVSSQGQPNNLFAGLDFNVGGGQGGGTGKKSLVYEKFVPLSPAVQEFCKLGGNYRLALSVKKFAQDSVPREYFTNCYVCVLKDNPNGRKPLEFSYTPSVAERLHERLPNMIAMAKRVVQQIESNPAAF